MRFFLPVLLLLLGIVSGAMGDCDPSRSSYFYHNCIVTDTQQIKCFGDNIAGQLGYGDTLTRGDQAGQMGDDLPFVDVDAAALAVHVGDDHTCALLNSLKVRCWGSGYDGQLGLGDQETRGDEPNEMGANLPVIDFGTNIDVVQLSVGGFHGAVLVEPGLVKTWGYNRYGQLGLEDTNNRGDDVDEMGDHLPYVNLGTDLEASYVICSEDSVCVLLKDGSVKCWGENNYGQLGLDDVKNRGNGTNQMGDYLPTLDLPTGVTVDKFVTGHSHHGFISSEGKLYLWGFNAFGQLGLGNINNIGDGKGMMGDNEMEMGDNLNATNLGTGVKVVAFSGGFSHSCAVTDGYGLKCWGDNTDGQLGYGDENDRGNDLDEMGDDLPLVDVGTGRTVIDVHAGEDHTCAVLDDNSMKCWGDNEFAQLGQGNNITDIGDEANEMGNNLPVIDLGSGVSVGSCFDVTPIAPTFAPSPSPTSSGGNNGGSDDDDSSSDAAIAISVSVVAIVLLGGGGGYYYYQKQGAADASKDYVRMED